ncbi:MAG: right-handed parallel beta-helix repeat-containing protein [Myxococcota bacterium]|nr:right-handed parallel beta-helix repeat-containing protein [Myxococcota bacterium]
MLAMIVAITTPSYAVDGVLEINQACAVNTGCFSGDTAGLPVQITAAGSYRLTSNLTSSGGLVIDINADAVTVDLNGFGIIGPTACSFNASTRVVTCSPTNNGSGHGIRGQGNDITVLNGTISGMGSFGILLTNGTSFRVDGVHATANAGYGIEASNNSLISKCAARRNGLGGIVSRTLGGNSRFDLNTAYQNGGPGLWIADGGVVTGNTSSQNSGDGINCSACMIARNLTNSNGGDGIQSIGGGTVVENRASSNLGYGLNLSDSGYAHNVVTTSASSLGTVSGGIQMGANVNVCDGNTTCP